jgi:hypothetical protein
MLQEHLMHDLENFVRVWSKGHDDSTDIDWSFMQYLKMKGALSSISKIGAKVGRRSSAQIHAAAQTRWDRLRSSRMKQQAANDHGLFVNLVDLAVSQMKLVVVSEDALPSDEDSDSDGATPTSSQRVPRLRRKSHGSSSPPKPAPRTPSPAKKSAAAKARWGLLSTPVAKDMVMQDPSRLQHDSYVDEESSAFADAVGIAVQAKKLGLLEGGGDIATSHETSDTDDSSDDTSTDEDVAMAHTAALTMTHNMSEFGQTATPFSPSSTLREPRHENNSPK